MEIIIIILGLVLGSFYNVVGLRIPNGESIIKPGSHCPKCNHKLSWYENIPVLSYIFLGGKCKNCKQKISIIYPIIEILTILILIIKFIYNGYKYCFIIIIYGLIVFGVMYLTMLLGNALFKKESLGGGDIKLSFISGLALGPLLGLFYIILASFLAFPYAIYISIKNKDTMLPFGPFLATSLLILYLNYDFFYEFLITLLHLK